MEFYSYHLAANDFEACVIEECDPAVVRRTQEPISNSWKAVRARWFGSNLEEGDFPTFIGYYVVPIFSERAWNTLSPLISPFCEALPIEHESGGKYYIIHVLENIAALDEERSRVERRSDGRIRRVYAYAFHVELVEGKHIFNLPNAQGGDLLVSEEFRLLVDQHDLKGLKLRPLPMAG